ncbi:hypothetical protein [Actinomadura hibisca]|uniref:hypothetical protein n=1 Tax=Actinomadura hibisca TaxID=68565 RepID=UPI000834DDB9|nr:hypothetical protein [Actinomadura hibisca]
MYAWLWRVLPGGWPLKAVLALVLAAALAAVLWYLVFPWLEPKVQFDHGVVNGTPSAPSSPG